MVLGDKIGLNVSDVAMKSIPIVRQMENRENFTDVIEGTLPGAQSRCPSSGRHMSLVRRNPTVVMQHALPK